VAGLVSSTNKKCGQRLNKSSSNPCSANGKLVLKKNNKKAFTYNKTRSILGCSTGRASNDDEEVSSKQNDKIILPCSEQLPPSQLRALLLDSFSLIRLMKIFKSQLI